MSGWTGAVYPNASGPQPMFPHAPGDTWKHDCGTGCLYDVFDDPNEHRDLAQDQPQTVAKLSARLDQLNAGRYEPDRGQGDVAACVAAEAYGGFYGPFVGTIL